jgi:hypothetical protein
MPGGRGKIQPSDNPKPFKKGDVGNPNGRPKKLPEIDALLAEVLGGDPSDPETFSEAKEVLKAMLKAAKAGNVQAQTAILDRAYGKPKQAVEHSGPQGGEIQVKNIIIEIPKDGSNE